jgi:hypothetical protein
MEEGTHEVLDETVESVVQPDTRHEAHVHARPRLIWGVAAVVVVVVGCLVWWHWGTEIKEACFGEEGACTVEIADILAEGAAFATTEDFK